MPTVTFPLVRSFRPMWSRITVGRLGLGLGCSSTLVFLIFGNTFASGLELRGGDSLSCGFGLALWGEIADLDINKMGYLIKALRGIIFG